MRTCEGYDHLVNRQKNEWLKIIQKKQKQHKHRQLLQYLLTACIKLPWAQKFISQIERSGHAWILRFPARRFIAGDTIEEALANQSLATLIDRLNIKTTFAYEVESTFDPKVAEKNLEEFKHCATTLDGTNDESMSIKLSALALFEKDPEKYGYSEPQIKKIKNYLRQLLNRAAVNDVSICIDMECFIYKDPTIRIFTELLETTPQYAEFLQLAFQCYLKDSPQDADKLVAWAEQFYARTNERVRLRVIKGANMATDHRHTQLGLHQDVITKDKETTQRQFIKIMNFFEQHTDCLDVAYGTMNPDSIAHIIHTWQENRQDPTQRQIQTLFGMHDPLKFALTDITDQQVYVPYAPLEKILAYMTRRFIELKESQKGAMPIMEYHNGELVQINK
ncbi:MAG: proline dehydrogenase family protein [Patescibacteria group bacterium]